MKEQSDTPKTDALELKDGQTGSDSRDDMLKRITDIIQWVVMGFCIGMLVSQLL